MSFLIKDGISAALKQRSILEYALMQCILTCLLDFPLRRLELSFNYSQVSSFLKQMRMY